MWPIEAADLVAEGRSLTELVAVGPFVGRQIHDWLREPPEVPDPPPLRTGFISYAEAREIVALHSEWESDLRGDLQMHTTYTDGGGTIGEMVAACEQLGHQYMALTDHSQQLKIAKGMDEAGFAKQDQEVAATNAALAAAGKTLRVLRGIEMNVSPEGAGDMNEGFLADRDIVLGAFHGQLRKKEDQTERYFKGARQSDRRCPCPPARPDLELPHGPHRRLAPRGRACSRARQGPRDRRVSRSPGPQPSSGSASARRSRLG